MTNDHPTTKSNVAKKMDNTSHTSESGQEQIDERLGHPDILREMETFLRPQTFLTLITKNQTVTQLNSLVTECTIPVAMTRKRAVLQTTQVDRNAVFPKPRKISSS
ncbi:unnamed protein product [Clavelina lepadiformis]|uniref:Uncharacterized protein n=1 Tax=Clavelina lepadiformis TaxID=159417 RepID=A0ABP0GCH5_CLALP